MRAALVRELPTKKFEVEEVDDPVLRSAEDLLIEVEACGICGTDLHILTGDLYRPTQLPFVLGHEPVGTVTEAGSELLAAWMGRRVTITLFTGCGQCRFCRSGAERLCPELKDITGVLNSWGGYAEKLVVRASQVVEVPAELSSEAAATLVDSGATAMNAAAVALAHDPEQVIVAGGGPVGLLVAEILGGVCDVLIVEPRESRRNVLEGLGHRVGPALEEVREVADVVIDCAGVGTILPRELELLRPRGLLVVVGYGPIPMLDFAPVARKELTLRGIRSGSRADLVRVLELASSNSIQLPPVETWTVDQINSAFAALRAGDVEGKAVITLQK